MKIAHVLCADVALRQLLKLEAEKEKLDLVFLDSVPVGMEHKVVRIEHVVPVAAAVPESPQQLFAKLVQATVEEMPKFVKPVREDRQNMRNMQRLHTARARNAFKNK